MSVRYEWDIETVSADEFEEVLDHEHRGALREFRADDLRVAIAEGLCPDATDRRLVLVLVRDRFDDETDELECRQWAYVEGGELPAEFDEGARVPARFLAEFKRIKGELAP